MTKTIPFAAAILFFTSCNQPAQPKPDADRVIKDTLAQIILQPFNQSPRQQNIYVKVEPGQEKFLCARDESIKQMMEGLKAVPQKFVISNTQASQVTGIQGTKLSFSPGSFINKEGNKVTDTVTIELKECYNPDAMLNENLLTAGSGGLSASRGMLCVNAYADGKILQLKEGETINVQFPFALNDNDSYKLYHGNENPDGLIVWDAACASRVTGPEVFLNAGFVKPEFSYPGLGLKGYLLRKLNYPDEAKRNELSANVEVTFEVNKDGKVTGVVTGESYKIFREEIEQSLKDMPAWKPAVYNGRNIASSVHVNVDFNIRSANQVQIDFNEEKASLISSGTGLYVLFGTDLKGGPAQSQGALTLGQTGWFNCSKPISPASQKAEVIVCANEKSEIRLVMKKGGAIAAGENCMGYADFKDLPLGQEAYIVAVRYDSGKMLYAVQPVMLNKQTVISLKWKRGDKGELAKVYRRLSKELS